MLNLLITDALGNQTFSKQEEVMLRPQAPYMTFLVSLS